MEKQELQGRPENQTDVLVIQPLICEVCLVEIVIIEDHTHSKHHPHHLHHHHHHHPIQVVVEFDGQDRHETFEKSHVTGRQIREKALVPMSDDLTRLVHGKPSGGNIGLDDTVEIRNGEHFLAIPTGTVS